MLMVDGVTLLFLAAFSSFSITIEVYCYNYICCGFVSLKEAKLADGTATLFDN